MIRLTSQQLIGTSVEWIMYAEKNTQAIKINVSLLNYHPGSEKIPQLIPIRICGRGVQQAQEHATLG